MKLVLRSASQENVVIIDQTIPAHTKVIGEMDTYSAMTLLHEEAIYITSRDSIPSRKARLGRKEGIRT